MSDPKRTPSPDQPAPPGMNTDPPRRSEEAEEIGPPSDEGPDAGEKAKEWGERRETGKSIGRAGKADGPADGVPEPEADDSPE